MTSKTSFKRFSVRVCVRACVRLRFSAQSGRAEQDLAARRILASTVDMVY
jgi:hypothetical protein